MSYENDIFEVLNKLTKKDTAFFDSLTEKQLKELQPLILMRWMSGINEPGQVFMLNEFVNPYVFSLAKHKFLLLYLITVCSFGSKKRLKWIKSSKRASSYPLTIKILNRFYDYSSAQSEEVIGFHSNDQIIEIAKDLEYQDDEIKLLKKELSKRL